MSNEKLLDQAKDVLTKNDRGQHTVPAGGLYPHQWLWDSCFIAIGMRHYDINRAQLEILSLFRGQWSNGMLPNIVLSNKRAIKHTPQFWRSNVSPYSPDNVPTSGITQPPVVAEAVVQIGKKLKPAERRSWYQRVYPGLLAYHQWLYDERDPHGEGLVLQIHAWETGLDNTPPWIYELHQHQMPFWIRAVHALRFDKLITLFRSDNRYALPGERMETYDMLALYSVQRRLRRKSYDIQRILDHSMLSIEDINFNSIFIRANKHLRSIAKTIGKEIPKELVDRMHKTEDALEQLWDAYSGEYYSRNFTTHKLIKVSSIGTLMPLYSGCITKERAKHLVTQLHNRHTFGPKYPVPTTPVNSDWFSPKMYWQGPTWINTNWLIADGLRRYGYNDEADAIVKSSLSLIEKSGFNEYFSPLDGHPAGVKDFSWTAALAIDFLST